MNGREFNLEIILELLLGYGYLDAPMADFIRQKEHVARQKLEKEKKGSLHFPSSMPYKVLPPELIESLGIKVAFDPEKQITEDLIYELLARRDGLRYIKIDPLKLDSKVVTGVFSRPFARRHTAVPIDRSGDQLFVAVADPYDIELFENLQRISGLKIIPVLASKADILKIITEVYGFRQSVTAAESAMDGPSIDITNLEQFFRIQNIDKLEENDRHVINAVDYLLYYAFEQRASDIHIEPRREHSQIRLRIDGILHDIYQIPKVVHAPVVSRLKTMGRLDIAERRKPQDGRLKTKLQDREIEIRVSTVPTALGEKMVLRLLDTDNMLQDIANIGFEESDLENFLRLSRQPNGLILVTGPTGSGKTTTLYSILRAVSSPQVNITTIEDPVEMVVESFNQIAVNPKVDITFASALRSVLRQDPDIIMVGEVRDPETAANAVQAALTGHMVFATLHTNDSVSSVARMLELGVKPYLLASCLVGVLAQRLVRKICDACSYEVFLSDSETAALDLKVKEGERLKAWKGEGCVNCRSTGYKGRSGIFELLLINERLRRMINEDFDSKEMFKVARQEGLMTLKEAAVKKLARGVTDFDEIIRVLSY